jgi:Redoxin
LFDIGTCLIFHILSIFPEDKFVNGAWAKDLGIMAPVEDKTKSPPITVLADGDGDLVQQLGLVEDMGYGIGVRSKRFVMILEDGVVRRVEVDEGMDQCEKTRADNIIMILTPEVASMDESDINAGALAGVCVVILAGLALSLWGDDGGTASTKAVSEGFNLLQQFGN